MSNILSNPKTALRAIKAIYEMTGSREQTGEILGVSGSTVTRTLKNAGYQVQTPGGQNKQLSPSALVKSYWVENQSLRDISAKAGVSHTTVARRMSAYGIPTRSV
jgi:transposase-like protein